MYHDPEILAMSQVYEAFKTLDNNQIKRVIDWLTSKFGIIDFQIPLPPHTQHKPQVIVYQAPVPTQPVVVQEAEKPIEEPIIIKAPVVVPAPPKAEETSGPGEDFEEKVEAVRPAIIPREKDEKEEAGSAEASTKNLGIKRFKTIENLFLAADAKTVSERILLAGAFLQEKLDFPDFTSHDINSRLKKMGYGIENVTNAINSLLKRKKPLMIQTKKEGDTKQSKRRYLLSPDGLQIAHNCLRKAK